VPKTGAVKTSRKVWWHGELQRGHKRTGGAEGTCHDRVGKKKKSVEKGGAGQVKKHTGGTGKKPGGLGGVKKKKKGAKKKKATLTCVARSLTTQNCTRHGKVRAQTQRPAGEKTGNKQGVVW